MAASLFHSALPRLGASLLRAPRVSSPAASSSVCAQCRRSFTAGAARNSGHNRWSKIRHEKGAADKKKNAQRSTFAKHLTMYSKLYGPDPNMNPQLATVISTAKKAGMPKANIDIAVARGQGKSMTGEKLETATLEVMLLLPGSSEPAMMVIDIESDNKQRALKDLRPIVLKANGVLTATAFMFERRGRTVLQLRSSGSEEKQTKTADKAADADREEKLMMAALEAGAEDVEDDPQDPTLVTIWTQPSDTHRVAQEMAAALGAEIQSVDIVYHPAKDIVKISDPDAAQCLAAFLDTVREYPDVQEVYLNVEIEEL